jgi:hypothetical protein
MFVMLEDVLPLPLLQKLINKYCNNIRNYEEHWYITNFMKTPLDKDDLIEITVALRDNPNLPFGKLNPMRSRFNCVNKILPGGSLPPHTDTVGHSITIFLNDIKENTGGEFFWHDDNDVIHTIQPRFNCAAYERYDGVVENHVHGVNPLSEGERYTIQLFYDIRHNDRTNIGVTPSWVDISKYKFLKK